MKTAETFNWLRKKMMFKNFVLEAGNKIRFTRQDYSIYLYFDNHNIVKTIKNRLDKKEFNLFENFDSDQNLVFINDEEKANIILTSDGICYFNGEQGQWKFKDEQQ